MQHSWMPEHRRKLSNNKTNKSKVESMPKTCVREQIGKFIQYGDEEPEIGAPRKEKASECITSKRK